MINSRKKTFTCSLSLQVCFLKVVHLWRFFHKFTFFQPNKFIPGGPFRLVGGGGGAFAPIAPPCLLTWYKWKTLFPEDLVLDQQIIVIRPFHFIQRSTLDDTDSHHLNTSCFRHGSAIFFCKQTTVKI